MAKTINKKFIYIGIAVVAVAIILYFLFRNNKTIKNIVSGGKTKFVPSENSELKITNLSRDKGINIDYTVTLNFNEEIGTLDYVKFSHIANSFFFGDVKIYNVSVNGKTAKIPVTFILDTKNATEQGKMAVDALKAKKYLTVNIEAKAKNQTYESNTVLKF